MPNDRNHQKLKNFLFGNIKDEKKINLIAYFITSVRHVHSAYTATMARKTKKPNI